VESGNNSSRRESSAVFSSRSKRFSCSEPSSRWLSCPGSEFAVASLLPNGRQVFGALGRLLHERAAEEARVRSIVKLSSAIAVVFVLQAGLCPALCFARSAEPASSQVEGASAPEKAPCHATSDAPPRDQTRECCESDCSHLGSVALAALADRVVLDAPAAAFSTALVALPPRANASFSRRTELASEPPPRNLLLAKNSFLI